MIYKLFTLQGKKGFVSVFPELGFACGFDSSNSNKARDEAIQRAESFLKKQNSPPKNKELDKILDTFLLKENIISYEGIAFNW